MLRIGSEQALEPASRSRMITGFERRERCGEQLVGGARERSVMLEPPPSFVGAPLEP